MSAVAAHRHDHGRLAAQPGRVGHADRVRQLGGQGRGVRGDAMELRVPAAVPVPLEQRERLDRVDAPGDDRHGVAVGREQPVAVGQHLGGGDLARLLPVRGRVDRQPALPDQRVRLLVEPPAEDQPGEGLFEVGAGRKVVNGMGDGLAAGVHQHDRNVRREKVVSITCHGAIVVALPFGLQSWRKSEIAFWLQAVEGAERPAEAGPRRGG